MKTFEINHKLLERVAKINLFNLPENTEHILFSVRGGLPTQKSDYTFNNKQILEKKIVNYKTFCCTIGIWNRKDKAVAVFPASTVPHASNIEKSVAVDNGGKECNQLVTGFLKYFKGVHEGQYDVSGLRHKALNGTEGEELPCIRLEKNSMGILEFGKGKDKRSTTSGNNFHPAYNYFSNDGNISASSGCQILPGYPNPDETIRKKGKSPSQKWEGHWNIAAWNQFYQRIDGISQHEFPYMLLRWEDYEDAIDTSPMTKVRFGSEGDLITQLNDKLGLHSSKFDLNTFKKMWDWQKEKLKIENPSDFLTQDLAQKLGINLPKV